MLGEHTESTWVNDTRNWQVVADSEELLYEAPTEEECMQWMDENLPFGDDALAETPWAAVRIMGPGESWSGQYIRPIAPGPSDEYHPIFNPNPRGGIMRRTAGTIWWNVYLHGKKIDTVAFDSAYSIREVYNSLMEEEYPAEIELEESREAFKRMRNTQGNTRRYAMEREEFLRDVETIYNAFIEAGGKIEVGSDYFAITPAPGSLAYEGHDEREEVYGEGADDYYFQGDEAYEYFDSCPEDIPSEQYLVYMVDSAVGLV